MSSRRWAVCATHLRLCAGLLFLLLHTIKFVHKRWIKHVCKAQRNSHLSTMIGSLLVMFYYLYLYLTRTTLDVFNCGMDGKEYMEAVFEECYVPGLTQMTLLPYACVTLVVYTLVVEISKPQLSSVRPTSYHHGAIVPANSATFVQVIITRCTLTSHASTQSTPR